MILKTLREHKHITYIDGEDEGNGKFNVTVPEDDRSTVNMVLIDNAFKSDGAEPVGDGNICIKFSVKGLVR
jgi:hypothetical protein